MYGKAEKCKWVMLINDPDHEFCRDDAGVPLFTPTYDECDEWWNACVIARLGLTRAAQEPGENYGSDHKSDSGRRPN
jgi:hypothetical protein